MAGKAGATLGSLAQTWARMADEYAREGHREVAKAARAVADGYRALVNAHNRQTKREGQRRLHYALRAYARLTGQESPV